MNEQERQIIEESENEDRHAMGVIVWIAIAVVFFACGMAAWIMVSLPWGVR